MGAGGTTLDQVAQSPLDLLGEDEARRLSRGGAQRS